MSAVFGVVSLDGRPAAQDELDRMCRALAAHGPDGGGIWIGEGIGLGQWLTCFTPEDRLQRQPVASAGGHHVAVCDARVDNRAELAHELRVGPAEFTRMADSAFILRAYEKWGLGCCDHILGDFVFALADLREGHVFCARSPRATRTLYYHSTPQRFSFSSAPKGLFSLPWVRREIDEQTLADYLAFAPREPGRSLYANVSELEAGHGIVVTRKGVRLVRNWQPELSRDVRFPRDSDYVDAFNALLERVVADHLRSITPVGVMMSGGLDSSAVAVTAAAQLSTQGTRLATFTEVPRPGFEHALAKQRYADETSFVEAIASRMKNLDLNFVRTGQQYMLEGVGAFFNALEGPFRACWNRLWWEAILCLARSQGIRVLLTGLPGNLTASRGGETLFAELLRKGRWVRAYREAAALSGQMGRGAALHLVALGAIPLLPTSVWLAAGRWFRPGDRAYRSGLPWHEYSAIDPEFAKRHLVEERARQKGHDFRNRLRYQNRAQRYMSLIGWDAGIQVSRGYEALFGVQTRDPLGDLRMVEFCLALPEEQYLHNGVSRRLIRRSMHDRLPAEVLFNQRRGLQAADWFEGVNAARDRMLAELTLIESSEMARTALDLKRVRRVLQQMAGGFSTADRQSPDYRAILGSGFMGGSFLRWFESARTGQPEGHAGTG